MPWKPEDAERHIAGLAPHQQKAWAEIANSALASCLSSGGDTSKCEGYAVRVANAKAKRVKEADVDFDPDEAELAEAVTKSESDGDHPASHYAYVPDPSKPSTWKLRIDDAAHVGGALAALGKGYRGQKVDLPEGDVGAVKAKVLAAWRKFHPGEEAPTISESDDEFDEAHRIAKWNEEDHPRDNAGKFAKKAGDTEAGHFDDMDWDTLRQNLDADLVSELDKSGITATTRGTPPWASQVQSVIDEQVKRNRKKSGWVEPKKSFLHKAWDTITGQEADVDATTGLQLAEAELEGDFIALEEKSVRTDGTIPVKVIKPGWGTSGYYPKTTLARDFKVFEGAKMYWNHPTRTSEKDRPERDLNDLAGVITGVHWQEDGGEGPGIYGDAKVFSPFKERLDELAPYIGVSILAAGQVTKGEAEGKKGSIVEAITGARSVDFVTTPGAGGKVLQLFEAARPDHGKEGEQVDEMRLQETTAKLTEAEERIGELEGELKEANDEIARLRETVTLAEAATIVAEELDKDTTLPSVTKERLSKSLSADPPIMDGKLDADALKAQVSEAVKEEAAYLASISKSGAIKGFGGDDQTGDDVEAKLEGAFAQLGLSESAAKTAAVGRG